MACGERYAVVRNSEHHIFKSTCCSVPEVRIVDLHGDKGVEFTSLGCYSSRPGRPTGGVA